MTFCPPDPSSPFVAVPCPPPGAVAEHLALGLCLADDTPIAVILEEETSPGAPPTPLGWVNLVTGTFTAGSPPAGSHPCGVDKLTQLGAVLCDFQPDGSISGTALLEITYDDDGAVVSTRLIDPVTGNVYTPTGVLRPCEEPCTKCDTTVLCDNTSVPASQFVASTKVMMDTPNVAGSDGWNITAYNTGNVPSVQLGNGCPSGTGPPVPVPYPAFYMADWCAAYLAACGTADAGGSGCALNPGPALGVTSTAEGVGCAGGPDFQTACARYVMEKTFNTDAACTQIRVTSQRFRADGSAKVLVDGQDTGIFGQYNVSSPDGTIILNVAPGPHTMTVDWRDAGSPTWVQGGLTIECLAITPASTTSIEFLRTTCRTCSGSVLSVTDTTLDGQTPYVPSGTVVVCDPSAGNVVPPCAQCETHTLIDKVVGLDNQISCTAFLHKVCFNCDGTISSTKDTLLDGTSPYTPTGTVALSCDTPTFEDQVVCIVIAGVTQEGFRREVGNPNGTTTVTFLGANGATVVPDSWDPGPCPLRGVETQKVCDLGSATTLIARYLFDESGSIISTLYYELDGTGPVGPIGPLSEGGCCDPFDLGESCYDSGGGIIRKVRGERRCDPANPPAFTLFFYDTETGVLVASPVFVTCPAESFDFEEEVLCDDNGPFFRRFTYVNGAVGTITNFDLAGAAYVPVGTVHTCTQAQIDVEEEILCDQVGPFLRRYTYTDGGAPVVDNLTLAGAAYVPVAPIGVCSGNTQHMIRLCDDDGAQPLQAFYRIYTVDSSGAVTGFDNVSLTGNPYVLTGAAVQCDPGNIEQEILCDVGAGNTKFIRTYQYLQNGAFSDFDNYDFNGAVYVPVGPVAICPEAGNDVEQEILCDTNGPFLRTYHYDTENGGLITLTNLTLAGAAYVPVGAVGICPQTLTVTSEFEVEVVTLCDDNGAFLRRFVYDEATGLPTSVVTTDLLGNPYVTVGTVKVCDQTITVNEFNTELEFLCDSGTTTFLRRYIFNEATGAIGATADFTLAGAAYVPLGTVTAGVCPAALTAELDVEFHLLCDSTGTTFLRAYRYNEATGAFTSFIDQNFDGTIFVPVGAVGECSGCCVVSQVCLSNGHPGVVLRFQDGTFHNFDTITGLAFVGTDIVPCTQGEQATSNETSTVARQTGAGSVAIAANAKSVTFVSISGSPTVSISGGAAVASAAGVTLTWSVDSRNQTLVDTFTFTGIAGSDFIVITTR